MIRATCTWGDGPDVLLVIEDHVVVAHEEQILRDKFTHGAIKNGSTDLTVDQAESLGHQLLNAAQACRELDKSAEEYFKMNQGQGQEPIEFIEVPSNPEVKELDEAISYFETKVKEAFAVPTKYIDPNAEVRIPKVTVIMEESQLPALPEKCWHCGANLAVKYQEPWYFVECQGHDIACGVEGFGPRERTRPAAIQSYLNKYGIGEEKDEYQWDGKKEPTESELPKPRPKNSWEPLQ
jgi:hypothetical protein